MAKRAGTSGIRIELDEDSLTRLRRAFRVLGEEQAPFLRDALDEAGRELAAVAASMAPGSIGSRVEYRGIRGKGVAIRAVGVVRHPGARSMEFGRHWYWTGYKGRNMKSGRKVRRKGQAARPFLGVISGGAMAVVAPKARQRLLDAIEREWDRMLGGAV